MKNHVDADVIVIGAGPAGIAAAQAAGQTFRKVLLLEAGGPYTDELALANMFTTHTIPEVWWSDSTAVRTLSQKETPYLQARVFGGGSAVNGMICVPGDTSAFDWQPSIAPIVEHLLTRATPAKLGQFASTMIDRIGNRLGFSSSLSPEGFNRTGWAHAALWAQSESFERRHPDADRKQETVELVTHAQVDSIDLTRDSPRVFWATGEASAHHVVLACGALHTPRLLHRSGYSHNALGRWVSDHPALCFRFRPSDASPGNLQPNLSQVTAIGRWKSSAGRETADLQLMPVEQMSNGDAGLFLALTDPLSTGSVSLDAASARLDLRLLEHEDDLKRLRVATRELLSVLTDSTDAELLSGADNDLDDWMRANAGGYFHASGSAKFAAPGNGIVDGFGRMHQHPNISICDLSILPGPTTGNPMLVAFALGQLIGQRITN